MNFTVPIVLMVLCIAIAGLIFVTVVLLCFGIVFVVLFATMDDHLKHIMKAQKRWDGNLGIHEGSFFFDFYVVRVLAAILGIVPTGRR